MDNELENLRPEVQRIAGLFDDSLKTRSMFSDGWKTIRTELLRLAKVETYFDLHAPPTPDEWHALCARAEKAEAELVALKERIAEAKRVRLGTYPAHGSGYVQIIAEPREGDKTYRLLVDEPPAERGDR